MPLDLLHQTLHSSGQKERCRRLRLRILLVDPAFEGNQASDLVFLALLVMHPPSATRLAAAQTPAIDLDGDHHRRGRHSHRQLAAAAKQDLVVALADQFGANLHSDALDLAGTDLDTGEAECEGGVGKRAQTCGGFDDPVQERGTEVVVIQTQGGAEGEKSRGGSRDSGKPAHGRGSDRH